MNSRFNYHRKSLAIAKVFFDMYNGYHYHISDYEKDYLVRFHLIVAQIDEMCARFHIPKRMNLPNGMVIVPSYTPLFRDGYINSIEVKFMLEMNGVEIGRIKDIVCAYDSFAIDLGYIIIGSGLPFTTVFTQERRLPLCVEILKVVDLITNITWPAWKGKYPLKRGYTGPLLGWGDDPKYTIDGIRHTVEEWADIMGVDPWLTQRSMDEGLDIEDALNEAALIHESKPKHKKPPTHDHGYGIKMYTYKGRSAPLKEWAHTLGITVDSLKTRMERGATFEEAYEMGPTRMICIDGEWKYLTTWCREYDVNRKKVAKLLDEGLKPEDALLTARLRKVEEQKEKERQR